MCLAVPMKVKKVEENNTATVEFGGITKKVNVQLINNVKTNDYLLVHAGVAIEKLDTDEAETKLKLLSELK